MTESERYSRQILFQDIGEEGQRRLLRSRVAIVGCGAIGALTIETLARAGVGHLRIIDRDFVEYSNLQRQVLYSEADARQSTPKAIACQRHLAGINSSIEVDPHVEDLNAADAERLLRGVGLILDATDNFETRFLINDVSVKHGIPWIYAAAVEATAVSMTILPGETACFRCILPNSPAPGSTPTCDTSGVLLPAVSAVCAFQTTEALKLLSGNTAALRKGLIEIDLWHNQIRQIGQPGSRDPNCVCCGQRNFEFLGSVAGQQAQVLCGRDAVQISPAAAQRVDLPSLEAKLRAASRSAEIRTNEYLLRFTSSAFDLTVFSDGRAIVKGAKDASQARSIYSRYVGS